MAVINPTPRRPNVRKPRNTTVGIFVVLLVLVAVQAIAAQVPGPEFEEYVNKALKDWGVPGVAIAIVKDDRVVLAKGTTNWCFALVQTSLAICNTGTTTRFAQFGETRCRARDSSTSD